jgi:hypothetical protein
MTITAAEGATPLVSTSAAISTLALTFTSDQSTTNFVVGDVTVINGALSSFAGSGAVYTATFTPTSNFNGLCTIVVQQGAFTNAGAENNTYGAFIWTLDAPVTFGFDLEGDFPLNTTANDRKAVIVNGFDLEGDFPLNTTANDRKSVIVYGFQLEGDFPPPGGGIEAGIFSNA